MKKFKVTGTRIEGGWHLWVEGFGQYSEVLVAEGFDVYGGVEVALGDAAEALQEPGNASEAAANTDASPGPENHRIESEAAVNTGEDLNDIKQMLEMAVTKARVLTLTIDKLIEKVKELEKIENERNLRISGR